MRHAIIIILSLFLAGCDNDKNTITVYSGGVVVKVFHSTGIISRTYQGGYYFEDATTHKFVEASGTVVIEKE